MTHEKHKSTELFVGLVNWLLPSDQSPVRWSTDQSAMQWVQGEGLVAFRQEIELCARELCAEGVYVLAEAIGQAISIARILIQTSGGATPPLPPAVAAVGSLPSLTLPAAALEQRVPSVRIAAYVLTQCCSMNARGAAAALAAELQRGWPEGADLDQAGSDLRFGRIDTRAIVAGFWSMEADALEAWVETRSEWKALPPDLAPFG